MIMAAMMIAGAGMQVMQGINAKKRAKANAAVSRADLAEATLRNKKKINKALKANYKAFSINSLNETINLMQQNDEIKDETAYQTLGMEDRGMQVEGSSVAADMKDVANTNILLNIQNLERSQADQLSNLENSADEQMEETTERQKQGKRQIRSAEVAAKQAANAMILKGTMSAIGAAGSTETGQEITAGIDKKLTASYKSAFANFGGGNSGN